MPNPNPKTEHLQSKRSDSERFPVLARGNVGVSLPPNAKEAVQQMPDRAVWLRGVVVDALLAAGYLEEEG